MCTNGLMSTITFEHYRPPVAPIKPLHAIVEALGSEYMYRHMVMI